MAISILSGTPGTPGTDSGGSASVTFSIPSTVPDGSLIVAIHCNDYRDYTNMVAPTLSFGTPTMQFLGGNDGGSLLSHIKVWAFDYPAGASGTARTLTCTETGTHDGDKGLSVFALSGAAAAASCLDGTLTATGSPSSSANPHVLNGVTTSQAGSLLFGHIRTSNGAGGVTYTAPGSMTEQYDVANFTQFTGATETLAGTGPTGTRTFTPTGSVPWVGVLFAIAPAAAGAAPVFIMPIRRIRPVLPGQWRRGRVAAPVRAQVNPPMPFVSAGPPRRLRGLLPRRAHAVTPVPTQAVAAAPAYPPRPVRARLRGLRLFRPGAVTPVPSQPAVAPTYSPAGLRTRIRGLRLFRPRAAAPVPDQIVVVPPAYPPQSVRPRLRGLRLFRGHAATPVPDQVVVPAAAYVPRPLRARLKLPVFRRHDNSQPFTDQSPPSQLDPRPRLKLRPVRSHITAPPQPQTPPPLFTRIKLRLGKVFRGNIRTAAPPQIVIVSPARVAQATRARRNQFAARRHRGGVDGWMVQGVHNCTTPRPSTGTTTRGSSGITARPNTGITTRPC